MERRRVPGYRRHVGRGSLPRGARRPSPPADMHGLLLVLEQWRQEVRHHGLSCGGRACYHEAKPAQYAVDRLGWTMERTLSDFHKWRQTQPTPDIAADDPH